MPNEGPYGGKIVVRQTKRKDKVIPVVSWQASAREFTEIRDNLGTLEYAVRVVNANNRLAASRDRRCIVQITDVPVSPTVDTRVLIVAGYDLPDLAVSSPKEPRLLGQAYFITAGAYDPDGPMAGPYEQFPVKYDVTLFFDNYDLNRLGLLTEPDPSKLSLCYVQWKQVTELVPVDKSIPLSPLGDQQIQDLRSKLRDLNDKLQQAIDKTSFVAAARVHEEIESIAKSSGRKLVSNWEQAWRPVFDRSDPNMPARQGATNIDGVLREPIVVSADDIIKPPGSSSVVAKGLSEPAHLGIMFHGDQQLALPKPVSATR